MTARERRRWARTIPVAVAAALLEALTATGIYVLLRALGDPSSLGSLPLPARLLPHESRSLLVAGACCIAALHALKTLSLALLLRLTSRETAASSAALSSRLLRAYLSAPLLFHLRRNSADLIYTATQATDMVYQLVVSSLVSIVAEVLVLVGLGVVLVRTAPAASLAAVAATLAVLVAISQVTRRTFHGLGTVEHRWQESTLRTLAQALEGIKEVRLRGRESFVVERFAHERTQTLLVRHRFLTLSGISRLLLETTFVFGILSVVLVLAWSGSGRVGLVPVLAVYAYAGFRVIPCANRLQLHLANIRYGMPAIDRLRRDLDLCEGSGAVAGGGSTGAPLAFEREVVLDEVWYAYDRESAPVLQDLHLSIHRGESVGIVGATGAGKTTLVHLLLGFLVPSGGRVLVDGRDIHDDLRAWQRRIGFVPQAVHLIDDTLARNVAFCIPDDMVDPARVTVALRRAQLHEFVASQPAGLQTVLGERGVRLSGGERQRVAIARALYDDPDVLVFDEGTSSLDSRTEREMTRAIEGLYGEKTLIVVAHRLATVRGCDRIVLLEGGRIAAVGSFDELARDHAGFRRLAAMAEGPAEDGQRGTEPPARVP